jgi:hypothetical protein
MKRKNGKRFKVFTAGIVTAAVALQSAFFISGMKSVDAAEAYIYATWITMVSLMYLICVP